MERCFSTTDYYTHTNTHTCQTTKLLLTFFYFKSKMRAT